MYTRRYWVWSLEFGQQSRSPGLNLGARVVHQEYARASHLTTLWLAGQPPAQPSSVE